jgi:hypothetical protein
VGLVITTTHLDQARLHKGWHLSRKAAGIAALKEESEKFTGAKGE